MQILIDLVRPLKVILFHEITMSLDVCVRQYLLHWIIKESNERGDTILYDTQIFDGLDYWATHLHYLTDEGNVGGKARSKTWRIIKNQRRKINPPKC